ncbi:concanavalin A-like lectin/glucanase domain-containing protein [Polychytrium aggregatum]|uniref:concanavalin A-like lectin/glucanase domain-containing protein n=1 Tax=Polychytrium aggregatum TaxID=110093 RepID=UPI0022FF1CA4|nr:concanavalin A-like lectin/glucanase domain-containing protein [Polychytrium aggregatum]KAI9202463.1 concanavalin A-like lectin/glucanase domain-containing protein [Polychytrium aggregatum]
MTSPAVTSSANTTPQSGSSQGQSRFGAATPRSGFALAATSSTDPPSVVGNCISARYDFKDPSRIAAPAPTNPERRGAPPLIDYTVYDWTIDHAKDLVTFGATGGLMLSAKPPDTLNPYGSSTRVSSTRYILYGKITARLKAVRQIGFVTSFITMSDIGDEIDWEMVKGQSQSNVFYHQYQDQSPWNLTKLDPEKGTHYGAFVPSGAFDDWHIYEMDWTHNQITYSIDGVVQKIFTKAGDGKQSKQVQSGLIQYWYPTTPSLIQFSLWDAGDSDRTREWAGGATDWSGADPNYGRYAIFEYVQVQCYDDKDQPVPKWPADTPDQRAGRGIVGVPMNADGTVPGETNPFLVPNTNTSNLSPGSGPSPVPSSFVDPRTANRHTSGAGQLQLTPFNWMLMLVAFWAALFARQG